MAALVRDRAQIVEAFNDVVAQLEEHDGSGLDDRLRVFGLPADDLAEVMTERWELYLEQFDPALPEQLFAQAMLEGLLVGIRLGRQG